MTTSERATNRTLILKAIHELHSTGRAAYCNDAYIREVLVSHSTYVEEVRRRVNELEKAGLVCRFGKPLFAPSKRYIPSYPAAVRLAYLVMRLNANR